MISAVGPPSASRSWS
ncbi:hypothetical protein EYF80_060502 [Liparis tanakae]|uniref:Uncharacterized protein n=1 Tax=Liparis tanakae TaxID=230148 RepID=A0A4Z2EKL5_9TELE|nr:hypothetical protein EYF80_060502 [Liparis tanakae]